MDIYFLSKNPQEVASSLADEHITEMLTNTTKILCSAFRRSEGDKRADERKLPNSSCPWYSVTSWAIETKANFIWLWTLGFSLATEFQTRFHSIHPDTEVLKRIEIPELLTGHLMSPFPQTFPDKYRTEDIIISNRIFYCTEKLCTPEWTERERPEWIDSYEICYNEYSEYDENN